MALEVGCSPVIVVLGAFAQPCREALATLPSGLAERVHAVENARWAEGMSTTLRAGLAALGVSAAGGGPGFNAPGLGTPGSPLARSEEASHLKTAARPAFTPASTLAAPPASPPAAPPEFTPASTLVLVTDQVRLTTAALERLLRAHHGTLDAVMTPVTAAQYGGRLGVPAIFRAALLGELAGLSGDQGARKLLAAWADRAVAVPMPEALDELDTPEDLEALGLT